jgi:hypothetical protein
MPIPAAQGEAVNDAGTLTMVVLPAQAPARPPVRCYSPATKVAGIASSTSGSGTLHRRLRRRAIGSIRGQQVMVGQHTRSTHASTIDGPSLA